MHARTVLPLISMLWIAPSLPADAGCFHTPIKPADQPADHQPVRFYKENHVGAFSGEYRYTIPIDLPPAKGDLVPAVSLVYSSDQGHDPLGAGWRLSKSCIFRDPAHGVPRYKGPAGGAYTDEDHLAFRIGEAWGTLVYDTTDITANALIYRPKTDDGSLMRFAYHGYDLLDPGERWTVYDKNGKRMVFGGSSAVDTDPDGERVFAWCLSETTDLDGNRIAYSYQHVDGELYLDEIEYDLQFPAQDTHPKVVFDWGPLEAECPRDPGVTCFTDERASYHKGYRAVTTRRLNSIRVIGFDDQGSVPQPSTEYTLEYDPARTYTDGQTIRGLVNLASFVPPDGGPQTDFGYYAYPDGGTSHYTINDPGTTPTAHNPEDQFSLQTSHGECISVSSHPYIRGQSNRITNTLIDMDGDGDLDMLGVYSAADYKNLGYSYQWYWRENTDGTSLDGPGLPVGLPGECTKPLVQYDQCNPHALIHQVTHEYLFRPGVAGEIIPIWLPYQTETVQGLYDMTGDGQPDLVFVESGQVYVCAGGVNPVSNQREFANCQSWIAGEHLARRVHTHKWITNVRRKQVDYDTGDLFDINGDGLVDQVKAEMVDGQAYLKAKLNSAQGFLFTDPYQVEAPTCRNVDGEARACIRSRVLAEGETHQDLMHLKRAVTYLGQDAYDRSCMVSDLVDMNGDGLLDWVANDPILRFEKPYTAACRPAAEGSFRYYPGQTGGFDLDHPTGGGLGAYAIGADFQTLTSGLLPTNEGRGAFHDINGDGYKDFVIGFQPPSGSAQGYLQVKLGTSQGFTLPATAWYVGASVGARAYPGIAVSITPDFGTGKLIQNANTCRHSWLAQTIVDLDGDGRLDMLSIPDLLDIVVIEAADCSNSTDECLDFAAITDTPWTVFPLAPAANHGRMKRIDAQSGRTTTVSYGRPAVDADNRISFPKYVVSELEHQDAVTGRTRKKTYAYRHGRYVHQERSFRGFGEVIEREQERATRHLYLQGAFDMGREYLQELYHKPGDGDHQVLRKKIATNWDEVALDPGQRSLVRPSLVQTTIYDKNEGAHDDAEFTTVIDYGYDDAGEICPGMHLLETIVYNGGTTDARTDTFDYRCSDSDPYLVVKTRQIRSTADASGSTVHRRSRYFYDGMCTLQANGQIQLDPSGDLNRGQLCARSDMRYPGQPDAVTTFEYDHAGRLAQTTLPDGEQTQFMYHGTTPHLSSETNSLGHTVYFRDYHGLSGKAGRRCGPQFVSDPQNDKCDRTHYDDFGRPVRVFRTLDDGSGGFASQPVLTEEIAYDDTAASDSPSSVTVRALTPGTGDEPQIRRTYYDGFGELLLEERSHAGSQWAKTYYTYGDFSNLDSVYPPGLSAAAGYDPVELSGDRYRYAFDLLDRLVGITTPDGSGNSSVVHEGLKMHVYKGGSLPWHLVRTTVSNLHGEVVSKITYGRNDNQAQIKQTSTYVYDGDGRLVMATDPAGGLYLYSWYGDGQLYIMLSPSSCRIYDRTPGGKLEKLSKPFQGSTVEYDYDAIGRMEKRTMNSAGTNCSSGRKQTDTLVYDVGNRDTGRLSQVTSDDYRIDLQYDARGNVTRKTLNELATGEAYWIEKTFNAQNALSSIEIPDGTQVEYKYDASGQPAEIQEAGGRLESDIEYQASGKVGLLKAQVQ